MMDIQLSPADFSHREMKTAAVFDRYGIDANSRKSLVEWCAQNHFNGEWLVELLKLYEEGELPDAKLMQTFSLPTLLDYLQRTHNYYMQKRLPELEQGIYSLLMDTSESFEFRNLLANFYTGYRKTLFDHIRMEEFTLFPYIRHLISAHSAQKYSVCDHIPQGYSIMEFMQDHDDLAEAELHQMKEILMNRNDLTQRLSTFRIFLSQIESFEQDLTIHAFIEDEVLIPKALELEALVLQSN